MRVNIAGGSLWTQIILPLVTYRNVKIFLTTLLLLSLVFLVFVLVTEGKGLASDEPTVSDRDHSQYAVAVATDVSNPHLHYGIVVDCGSSGSRLYVYYWPPHDGNPKELLNIQQMKGVDAKPVVMKVEPGISEFADRPSEASDYIRPLLDYAARHIPTVKHKETPLYIMATAGMRMLRQSDQDALLADLRVDVALDYDFLFTDTQVEVISGKQEGIYAWISVNYALHKFDHINTDEPTILVTPTGSEVEDQHMRKRTVGMIDMGGGSIQIAYEVPKSITAHMHREEIAKSQLAEFNLGCTEGDTEHTYRVYVATFLGYGGNIARTRYEQLLVARTRKSKHVDTTTAAKQEFIGRTENSPIEDPCLPTGMPEQVQLDGDMYHIIGTGNFAQCSELQYPLLNQSVTCVKDPCSLNGMFQPPIDFSNSAFYGFSEFYYSMEDVLRMAGKYDAKSFEHAAQDFCSKKWSQLKSWYQEGLYPKADDRRFKMQCFKSAWIATVLHGGFHFPKQYNHFTSTQLIRGQDVQWTLGALVYKTRYFPLREIEKYSKVHQHHSTSWDVEYEHSYYLILLCLLIVLCAILVYLRRLKVVPSRMDLSRVPTMSYFMTDESQVEEGLIVEREKDIKNIPYYYSYAGS